MIDNKQAEAVLKRSLVSYVLDILWRSALLTAVLSLAYYLDRPKTFHISEVWVTFVIVIGFHTFLTLLGLLMAAGRYRKRPRNSDDD